MNFTLRGSPFRGRRGFLLLCCFTVLATTAQTKAHINRKTKDFDLIASMRLDHKIFGYELPSVNSKKMILFSVFTKDVKGNPNKCPLGSYYQTLDLNEGDKIMYVSATADFVKLNYIDSVNKTTIFYIRCKFVVFD